MLDVGGEIDGGHPDLPELPLDSVAAGEGGAEAGRSGGQLQRAEKSDDRPAVGWGERPKRIA